MMGTTECIPLVCNEKQLISVKVLVKLNFPKQNKNPAKEEIIQALLDTGCSETVVCKTKVPPYLITKSKHIQKTRTMSGIVMINDEEINNISLQFSTNCDLFGQKIHLKTMRVENLVPSKQSMIIGLDFILGHNRTITINKDYVIISDKTQMSPIISGDSYTKPSPDECSCTNNKSSDKCDCIKEDLESIDYCLDDTMDSFSSIKISKTITFDNIQQILDRLNKTSIIGEDPTKFWDRDPITCKLNIINPDLIIKTKDIQFNNWEQEECRMHIDHLLKLKVIAPSESPHRSPAFIVNKSS